MTNKIKQSYKQSKNIYDDIITHKSWWSKLYNRVFWNGVDDNEIANALLSNIPDDFSGKLLDVPVGTAIFTYSKYMALPNADITCLDYSEDMLTQARAKFEEHKITNVKAVQGDVGHLPFEDNTFDVVLSMNGFHAFPNKDAAFAETCRVLKPGGKFLACFYIQKQAVRSDLLVRFVLAPKGWFTPPFETTESLINKLAARYTLEHFETHGAIASFVATKR